MSKGFGDQIAEGLSGSAAACGLGGIKRRAKAKVAVPAEVAGPEVAAGDAAAAAAFAASEASVSAARGARLRDWTSLTAATAASIAAAAVVTAATATADLSMPPGAAWTSTARVDMCEFHVEASDLFDSWREKELFGGNMSVRCSPVVRLLIASGQDEAAYSSDAATSKYPTSPPPPTPTPTTHTHTRYLPVTARPH